MRTRCQHLHSSHKLKQVLPHMHEETSMFIAVSFTLGRRTKTLKQCKCLKIGEKQWALFIRWLLNTVKGMNFQKFSKTWVTDKNKHPTLWNETRTCKWKTYVVTDMYVCKRRRKVDLKDTVTSCRRNPVSLCCLVPGILSHCWKDECGRKSKCSASLLGELLLLYAFVHSLCFLHCIKLAKKHFHLCAWWGARGGVAVCVNRLTSFRDLLNHIIEMLSNLGLCILLLWTDPGCVLS